MSAKINVLGILIAIIPAIKAGIEEMVKDLGDGKLTKDELSAIAAVIGAKVAEVVEAKLVAKYGES